MDLFERIKQNPVLLYGAAGVFLGTQLGITKKERTASAAFYGAMGLAMGWFIGKSTEEKRKSDVSRVAAIMAAETAEAAAGAAEQATSGWGGYGIPRGRRPARGTARYRHARRMLLAQHGAQGGGSSSSGSYPNGFDTGNGAESLSLLSGAGVGTL